MTRSEAKQVMLDELGAVPVVADALAPAQVAAAVGKARPEVIVHQLTAIGALDPRHIDRDFASTNRLRTQGTDYLLSAGQAVGTDTGRAAADAGAAAGRGRGGRGADEPAARRRQRHGHARAGWQPRHPSWQRGPVR